MRTLCGTILAAAVVGGTFAASAAPEVSWSIMHPTGIDVKYMERVAAKAAEYGGVDAFEVCGPCHSPDGGINGLSMLEPYPKAHARVDAAAVEAARAKMNAIVSIAHGIGKPLYYWHREIFLQPGIIEDLPQMLDEDGEFDLLGSTYQDYLRFKIEEAFKFVPGLDGIVLTLTEADYSVIHNSNPERYPPAKVVEAIARIFAEEHAKRGKHALSATEARKASKAVAENHKETGDKRHPRAVIGTTSRHLSFTHLLCDKRSKKALQQVHENDRQRRLPTEHAERVREARILGAVVADVEIFTFREFCYPDGTGDRSQQVRYWKAQ